MQLNMSEDQAVVLELLLTSAVKAVLLKLASNSSLTMATIWQQELDTYRDLLTRLDEKSVPDENPMVETYGDCPKCGQPTEGRYCPYCGWTVPDSIPAGIYDMATVTIVFDGGSKNNGSPDAEAYGSYQFETPELGKSYVVRLQFPAGTTNNQAEYMALLSALEAAIENVEGIGYSTKDCIIKVFGDSQLVIKQLKGEYKLHAPGLGELHFKAVNLLARFKSIDLNWWPREESVAILGH